MKKQLLIVVALLLSAGAPKLQAWCIYNQTGSTLRVKVFKTPGVLKAYDTMVKGWKGGKEIALGIANQATGGQATKAKGILGDKFDLGLWMISRFTALNDYKLNSGKSGCYNWLDFLRTHYKKQLGQLIINAYYPNLIKAKKLEQKILSKVLPKLTPTEERIFNSLRMNTKVYVAVINTNTGTPIAPVGAGHFVLPIGGQLNIRANKSGELEYYISTYDAAAKGKFKTVYQSPGFRNASTRTKLK